MSNTYTIMIDEPQRQRIVAALAALDAADPMLSDEHPAFFLAAMFTEMSTLDGKFEVTHGMTL